MDHVSLTKANRLFWLGRYSERVYTTLQYLRPHYDRLIDGGGFNYPDFCARLGIPCPYTDEQDFFARYPLDPTDPCSIRSAADQMLGNGMVLRETLSSTTLSYLQMAVSAMEQATRSTSPAVEMQWVLDDILAFRGSFDDYIDEESTRNIIKCGIGAERISLYLRLGFRPESLGKELSMLLNRLYKSGLETDPSALEVLTARVVEHSTGTPDRELAFAAERLFLV